jgi:hypothetical protein
MIKDFVDHLDHGTQTEGQPNETSWKGDTEPYYPVRLPRDGIESGARDVISTNTELHQFARSFNDMTLK